jgi:hypothetical protein
MRLFTSIFKHVGISSWGGAIGMSTIVDDYSRKIDSILLASKTHFVDKFQEWAAQVVESQGYKIRRL